MPIDMGAAQPQTPPHPGSTGQAPPKPQLFEAAAVECKKVKWLWYPYVPADNLSLIGSNGGGAKGLTCMAMVATVTTAGTWPDGKPSNLERPGHVLWGETEDPREEVLKPRLVAAGADCKRVTFITPQGFADLDRRKFIQERSTRLIVLSPFVSFLEGLQNMNHEMEVRSVLERLLAELNDTGCAIMGVAHTNKKADLAAIERLLGSVAFVNFVRSVLLIAPNKSEEEEATHRLVHAKHNLSIKGSDLLFTPKHVGEDPTDQFVKLIWSENVNGNVDADALFDRHQPKGNGKAKMSAEEWLIAFLTGRGETEREIVIEAGAQAGFKEQTLKNAMTKSPKLKSERRGFASYGDNQAYWSVA
jgi:DNA repair protein RadA/Sms